MNWKLSAYLNNLVDLTASQRSVLWALSGYADEKMSCWPSYATLSKKSGCSRRYVINAILEFEKMGLITIKHVKKEHKNNSNIYQFTVVIEDKLVNTVHQGSDLGALGVVNVVHQGSDLGAPYIDTLGVDIIEVDNKKTIQKKKKNEEKKAITKKVNLELKLKFDCFWNLYLKKRNKKSAQKKFETIVGKKLHIADEIIAGTKKHVQRWKSQNTKLQFIPYPETFLNKGAYADEFDKENSNDIWSKYL